MLCFQKRANGSLQEAFWINSIALLMVFPSSQMAMRKQKEKKKSVRRIFGIVILRVLPWAWNFCPSNRNTNSSEKIRRSTSTLASYFNLLHSAPQAQRVQYLSIFLSSLSLLNSNSMQSHDMLWLFLVLLLSGGSGTGDNNLNAFHAIQALLRTQRKFFISHFVLFFELFPSFVCCSPKYQRWGLFYIFSSCLTVACHSSYIGSILNIKAQQAFSVTLKNAFYNHNLFKNSSTVAFFYCCRNNKLMVLQEPS